VLRRDLLASARCHSDRDRHLELAAGHVPHHGGVVHDLVDREQAEVHGHHLDDWAHAAKGSADAGANERRLAKWRVADAFLAELFKKPLAHGVGASVPADVFAHEEHARVFPKKGRQRRSHGLSVGRHDSSLE